MAKQTQPQDGVIYLVNPAGSIHTVTMAHAKDRLRLVGWRTATKEEIAQYKAQKVQRHDKTIAPRWQPLPLTEPELPEQEA